PAGIELGIGDRLGGVAGVLPVDLAEKLDQLLLLLGGGMRVDEIVEPAQLPQTVLAAEFVEPRDSALAVADQIQRRDIDPLGGALQASHLHVLQKARMILERRQSQALASHAMRPVAQA